MALSRTAKWTLGLLATLGATGLAAIVVILVLFFRPVRSGSAHSGSLQSASVRLGEQIQSRGLAVVNQNHDGATEPSNIGGSACHSCKRYPGRPELYAYFRLDPALKRPDTNEVTVEVEYFDGERGGHFRLDYDSFNHTVNNHAYTQYK